MQTNTFDEHSETMKEIINALNESHADQVRSGKVILHIDSAGHLMTVQIEALLYRRKKAK